MNKFFYVAAGIITFLVFILVMAPASLLVSLAGDNLQKVPDLEVGRVEGRIWAGAAELQYQSFPALVSWNLAALPLALGRISADVEVAGDGLDAAFHVSANSNEGSITGATAFVDARYINQVSIGYGLDLSGQFSFSSDEVSFNRRWITAATGDLDWPGGIVHIETPERLHTVDLPPLRGKLSMDGDSVKLAINDTNTPLIDLSLKPSGWAAVGVSFAFIELAGLPIPLDARTDVAGPALLIEEKVL